MRIAPFLQFLNNIILYFLIIPGITALKSIFNIKNDNACRKLCIIAIISNVVSLILHFTNIADVHETLPMCHFTIGFCAFSLVFIIAQEKIKSKRETENSLRAQQINLRTSNMSNKKIKLIINCI